MSIALVVTGGFGNGTFNGTVADVVRRGYSSDAEAPPAGDPLPPPTAGILKDRDLQKFRDRFTSEYTRARILQEDEEMIALILALITHGII